MTTLNFRTIQDNWDRCIALHALSCTSRCTSKLLQVQSAAAPRMPASVACQANTTRKTRPCSATDGHLFIKEISHIRCRTAIQCAVIAGDGSTWRRRVTQCANACAPTAVEGN